jgi:hypothetical protein
MNCPNCQRPLTEIDYYGEVLVGCIECNRWGKPGDKKLVMELLEADLERLRKARASIPPLRHGERVGVGFGTRGIREHKRRSPGHGGRTGASGSVGGNL